MTQAEMSLYAKAGKLSKSRTKCLFSPAPPVRCAAPAVWSASRRDRIVSLAQGSPSGDAPTGWAGGR